MKISTSRHEVKAVARGGGDAAELSGHPVAVLMGSMGHRGVTMYEAETQPGEGMEMHVQNGDAYLYVVEGVYQISAGEKVTIAGAGTAVFVPRGIAQGFTNISDHVGRLVGFTTAKLMQKLAQVRREDEELSGAAANSEYGFQLCIDCVD